jgi:hypothetical protein
MWISKSLKLCYVQANLSMSEEDQIDISVKLQIGTVALRRRRERLPLTNPEVIDIPKTENGISEMFPNPLLLSQPIIPSRRASAPPFWIEETTEPVAGPSHAMVPARAVYLDELETRNSNLVYLYKRHMPLIIVLISFNI